MEEAEEFTIKLTIVVLFDCFIAECVINNETIDQFQSRIGNNKCLIK